MECADWTNLGHVLIPWETSGTESGLKVIPQGMLDTEQIKTTDVSPTWQTLLILRDEA